MHIQFNSDNQTPAGEEVAGRLEAMLRGRLSRFDERLTRIEVHVADVNGPRGGLDVRCTIEARPTGLAPVAASADAANIDQAASAAADKLAVAIDRIYGKRTTRKGH